ncbi:MAG TPA: NYN domain-containing protein [Longimicrobiales bacterium]
MQNAPNAALLIDFDNVTMGIRSDLSKELKKLLNSDIIKGKVAVQRAYADWRRYPQYIAPLSEASVDLIFAPAYGSTKKNATDIRLAIDALELVFTRPEIGTFILLTGDSDFSSLVLKLKEYGKYVIGVGIKESSSDLLVQNCDEYYSYSALTGLTRAGDEEVRERPDPWELVEQAVRQMAASKDVMRSDRLKQVMMELDPAFDEGALGFSKFSRFLQEAAARGHLRLKKLENGQFEVAPPDDGEAEEVVGEAVEAAAGSAERARAGERKSGSRSRRSGSEAGAGREAVEAKPAARESGAAGEEGRASELRAAYELLTRAVADLVGERGEPVRDSDVKRRMLELEPGWDESRLGFGKFSRFLRQAHDSEVIDLRKAAGGRYEVSLPAGRRAEASAGKVEEAESGKRGGRREPKAQERTEPAEARAEREAAKVTAPAASGPVAASSSDGQPAVVRPVSRPTIGLGFRRGSRGRVLTLSSPPPLLAGQTVSLDGERNGTQPEPAAPAAVEAAAAAAEPVTEPVPVVAEAPAEPATAERERKGRGGRQRRSGRARTQEEAPAAEAAAQPQAVEAAPRDIAAELGLPMEAPAVVEYLSTNYKGVGRKTAEQLVQALGAENVFRVLDEEAERVREILGARRANVLLEAWAADRAARRAEAAPVVEVTAAAPEPQPETPAGGAAEAAPAAEKKAGGRSGRSRGRRGSRRGGQSRRARRTEVAAGGGD